MLDAIRRLKETGQFAGINQAIPYSGFIGLECELTETGLVTILRRRDSNIGNTKIPAIHGGVVGAALEHAATMELLYEVDLEHMPRIVNISIDYLRPALDLDTFMRARIVRQGRRIANVRVEGWQSDPSRPVAAAHAHFLLGDT
jgi:acyl-coenzyme A thioesterase PaaI-like protein